MADYVERHFREPLTVTQLADRAGLSREHFTREFQRHTAQPPGRFLRERRADSAAKLLVQTSWSRPSAANGVSPRRRSVGRRRAPEPSSGQKSATLDL